MAKCRISGQQVLEYALCLAVVAGALIGMQLYLQPSFQAKYKQGADYLFSRLREEASARDMVHLSEIRGQYDPYYATSNIAQRHGEGTIIPADWGRRYRISRLGGHIYAADPDIESKDWDEELDQPAEEKTGAKHIDAVSGRSGWQRIGPAQDEGQDAD